MQGADAVVLGRRIRSARRAKGLTQRQLAQGLVSIAYISRIEAGTRRASPELVRQIALRLSVHEADLIQPPLVPHQRQPTHEAAVAQAAASWLRGPRDPALYVQLVEAVGRWEVCDGPD